MYYDIIAKRQEEIKEITKMIKTGNSYAEIKKQFDINYKSFRTLRSKYN